MTAIGFHELVLLLGLFIAIDSSEVYPPEVSKTFVENALARQTFTQELPADTVAVFMTANFGVCKSKKGVVIPLSEAVAFAKDVVGKRAQAAAEAKGQEMVDTAHAIYRSVIRMFHGQLGVALLNLPEDRRRPDFIVRADIDEMEMTFVGLLKKIAAALPTPPPGLLPREEEGYLNFADKLYVRIEDKKLYAANSRAVIEKFLSGAWKGNPLSNSPLYRAAGKRVEFDQEQFLFVNVERIWQELTARREPVRGEINMVFGGLLSNVRVIASSARLSSRGASKRTAVLFKDLTTGVAKILARPNAPSEAATFVPADYSLLLRVNTGSPVGLLRDVMGLHEDVARELGAGLERVEQNLGVSIEKDVLPALSGDFALAAKVPPMVGIPESLFIARIADVDKASAAVERIVEETGVIGFDEEYRGGKLRVLPLPLVSPAYVFVESHLLVGSSPEIVKKAIDARLSGKNLAASQGYRAALEGHPSESVATVYADTQAIFEGATSIGGGLAMRKGERKAREIIAPLIALLRRNAKGLTPVSCSIYREDNAILLRTNGPLFAAGPVPFLLPTLFVVRQVPVEAPPPVEAPEILEEITPR